MKTALENVKIKVTAVENTSEYMKNMNAYKVTLFFDGKQYTTPFYTGYGWKREPNEKDVLHSLIMDAQTFDCSTSYENFCHDFGYEPMIFDDFTGRYKQNKQARDIYKACERTSKRLHKLLGDSYEEIADELQDY